MESAASATASSINTGTLPSKGAHFLARNMLKITWAESYWCGKSTSVTSKEYLGVKAQK